MCCGVAIYVLGLCIPSHKHIHLSPGGGGGGLLCVEASATVFQYLSRKSFVLMLPAQIIGDLRPQALCFATLDDLFARWVKIFHDLCLATHQLFDYFNMEVLSRALKSRQILT
jgi:hypothetical protein